MCKLEFKLYIITNSIIWELYFNDMLAMEIHVCCDCQWNYCIVVAKQF